MRKLALTGLTIILAASSYAATITTSYTGVGSGQIGSTAFTNAAFNIINSADTNSRQSFSGGFYIDDFAASIQIIGLGVFSFTTGTRTFVNNGNSIVGFARAGSGGVDLYDGPANALFATWDMLSQIGPVSGTADLLQWASSPVNTDGGVLTFNSGTSSTVFLAVLYNPSVPEPSSVILLGTGLIGLAGMAWRRRKSVA